MNYYVYFLRGENNTLYIGHTNDLLRRENEHLSKHGAKYTQDNNGFRLVYSEIFTSRQEAMKREKQLKKWTRAKKEALIVGDINLLKRL